MAADRRPSASRQADFDVGREIAALTHGRTDIGAVVTFTGICRGSEGGERDRGADARALSRHGGGRDRAAMPRARCRAGRCTGVTVIHRYGRIAPGENIVLVVTASAHRAGGVRRRRNS